MGDSKGKKTERKLRPVKDIARSIVGMPPEAVGKNPLLGIRIGTKDEVWQARAFARKAVDSLGPEGIAPLDREYMVHIIALCSLYAIYAHFGGQPEFPEFPTVQSLVRFLRCGLKATDEDDETACTIKAVSFSSVLDDMLDFSIAEDEEMEVQYPGIDEAPYYLSGEDWLGIYPGYRDGILDNENFDIRHPWITKAVLAICSCCDDPEEKAIYASFAMERFLDMNPACR